VLATQTLLMKKARNMRVTVSGKLPFGCTAKDIVLAVIGRIGTAGGTGYAIGVRRVGYRGAVDGRADDGVATWRSRPAHAPAWWPWM